MMTDDKLIEEICDLVKEYTCMEMGYFFKYDLRDKINQYYEDNYSQEVNENE